MSYCTTCQSHYCSCQSSNYCSPVPCNPCNTGCPSNCRCSSCCSSTGCPITLDSACVKYHKNNSEVTALTNLGITNGATLESILEAIDPYIGQLLADAWSLSYLRDSEGYTINTLEQFAVAVDSELSILNRFKGNVNADPVTLDDGDYFFRVDLDQLRIRLNGVTRQITII